MAFDLARYPLAFDLPVVAFQLSQWLAHTPLAPILVEMVRPEVLVELGTHGAGDASAATTCR